MKTHRFHKIREQIAMLSKQQREEKPQRKTVHFKGERTMSASEAAFSVMITSNKLMHLYHAYAQMKGIELPAPKRSVIYPETIKKMVQEFAPEEVATEEAA